MDAFENFAGDPDAFENCIDAPDEQKKDEQLARERERAQFMFSWRQLIDEEMRRYGESFDDVVACTLSDEQLDREFYTSYGSTAGDPFTLWTRERVYFPARYDGAEWVASVSRHPNGEPTEHVGG